ncbi:lysosomal acid glucosylceramidase-like [Mercenaria mercenaria]|uniref:lysosomal acid glucosylceramidase-like n=1 Tax=Mercenaria mercenaria TaxID=6596 RepID=UPI00234F73D2|nr:lysosomal acid glucosylceramidase-like [Mercenaria mercenaria]
MMLFIKLLFVLISMHEILADEVPCFSRQFDQDSVVCVCNSTYCDYAGIEGGGLLYTYFNAFVTTKDGLRLDRQLGSFDDQIQPNKHVFHLGNDTRQTILGFGGAFTDAATMTMNTLSPQARANLINSYYGQNGIEYTMGRIPMASCDFSKRIYSYDDVEGDLELKEFALTEEDLLYKIPAIKDAMKVSKRNVTLFGSPWSSPYWMKTNNNMTGKGTIKDGPGGQYYKSWAKYFVKFLQAYKQQGLNMWGLTAQNEPSDGNIDAFPFQCLGFDAESQRNFIANDLGPALEQNGFGGVKLMILDDERKFLPSWADVVLKDHFAAKYVSGIAVHWYDDMVVPPSALDDTYKQFGNDYFILNTEACVQDLVNKSNTVLLGNWQRGERYFMDILQDIEHGVSGWVDWNMALDMQGGPNWQNNLADSPVIVNAQTDEFYKQPMFYAMGHFSKFARPGSKVISHSTNVTADSSLKAIFFTREDDSIAANFVNTNDTESFDITITDYRVPGYLNYEIPPKTFVTFIWYRI